MMNHRTLFATIVMLSFLSTMSALGQSTPAVPPQPPKTPTPPPNANAVAVTVNGHEILESKIEEMLKIIIDSQSRGRPLPPAARAQMREQLKPRIVETLIDNRLLDEDAERSKLTVTDKEFVEEMEKSLQSYLLQSGISRKEFGERIQAEQGMPLEAFISKRAALPEFRQSIRQQRLLEKKFPNDVKVSPDEVKTQYQQDLEARYTKPAMVKASHILIGTGPSTTAEEKAEAKKKAETILSEVKKPGADFAALAGQHSSCSSKSNGGDLGFFPRKGAMVEPFAAAAFTLKTGQISDVVETQFGYHVIKVTEKKEAEVTTLADATESIRQQLRSQKIAQLRGKHVAALRKDAKIVFPEAKNR
ncbi:MAG: peptidylprolyl isomerase [Phycisphaerales bacterium]|nr:peptidylprolyl isomerase [Phycisphaerales bacterium]